MITCNGNIKKANLRGFIQKDLVLQGKIKVDSLKELTFVGSDFTLVITGKTKKKILKQITSPADLKRPILIQIK
ncbi:hypothetical protein GF323_02125 [Candidatus Woesearchaeota archaeon]|nr:hypothetical protein [Candidatus Woesearchaeota archaeon]